CPHLRSVWRGHAVDRCRTIDVARFWSDAAPFAFHRATHQRMPLCPLRSGGLHHPDIAFRCNSYPPAPRRRPPDGEEPLRSLRDAGARAAATLRACRRGLSRQGRLPFQADLARARTSARLRVHQEILVSRPRRIARELASSARSEEHTSELQSRVDLVCRLLLE